MCYITRVICSIGFRRIVNMLFEFVNWIWPHHKTLYKTCCSHPPSAATASGQLAPEAEIERGPGSFCLWAVKWVEWWTCALVDTRMLSILFFPDFVEVCWLSIPIPRIQSHRLPVWFQSHAALEQAEEAHQPVIRNPPVSYRCREKGGLLENPPLIHIDTWCSLATTLHLYKASHVWWPELLLSTRETDLTGPNRLDTAASLWFFAD